MSYTSVFGNIYSQNYYYANGNSIWQTVVANSLATTGNITVGGDANIQGNLYAPNYYYANGNSIWQDIVAVTLNVSGNTNLANTSISNANISNATVTNITISNAAISNAVIGNANVQGNVFAGGYYYSNGNSIWQAVVANTLNVSGNSTLGNTSIGNANVQGNIFAGGYYYSNGNSIWQNVVVNTLTSAGNITVGGNARILGNLLVTGNIYRQDELLVGNTVIVLAGNANSALEATGSGLQVGNANYASFLWDASTSTWYTGTANISANYVLGNGALLTGLNYTNYSNANVANYLPIYTGNISAGNVAATGNVTANVIVANRANIAGNVTAIGNISGNILLGNGAVISGNVTATSNVTANNFIGNGAAISGSITAGANITATGNVTANIIVANRANIAGNVTATGNVSGNILLGNGAVISGNITATANIAAVGNVSGNNLIGNSAVISGNITGNNIFANRANIAGNVTATGNISGNVIIGNAAIISGNITVGNITANGNISAGNLLGNIASASGFANLSSNVVTTGNIQGSYILGNGAFLTGLPSSYSNANVAAYLPNYQGLISNIEFRSTSANVAALITNNKLLTIGGNILSYITIPNDANANVIAAELTNHGLGNVLISSGPNDYEWVFDHYGNLFAPGNIDAGNVVSANYFIGDGSLLTNIAVGTTYSNANVAAYLVSNSAVTILTTGNITTAANVTGNYYFGNGAFLTGIVAGTNYSNANVADYLASNANVTLALGTGNITTLGNVTGNYYFGNGAFLTGIVAGTNYSNANVADYLASNANITLALGTGNITTQGNVAGTYYFGNGRYLTGIVANASYSNADVAAYLASNANITLALGTGNITTQGNVAGGYIFGNGAFLTGLSGGGGIGNSIVLGEPSQGNLVSNAVTMTPSTTVTDGVALLNQILGKLVPPAPAPFPAGQGLSIATSGVTARMTNYVQPDNTPGANKSVAAGTLLTVLRTPSYTTTNIVNAGPGDTGTLSAYINGTLAGNTTFNPGATPNVNGVYDNLVVTNNYDYHQANAEIAAGFWYVFSAGAAGTVPAGWNEVYIGHTAAGNSNTVSWFYDTGIPGSPTFSNASITACATPTLSYSSTIPHYTGNTVFGLGFKVSRLSGNTYPNSNTLSTGSAAGAFQAPANVTYSAAGIAEPLAQNLYVISGSATANTTAAIVSTGFGGSSVGPNVTVNNSYGIGNLSFTLTLSSTVLYKNGNSTAVDEGNITVTSVGVGSGNAYRIVNPGSGNTPAYTANATAFNSQSSTLQTYDATVVGLGTQGVVKHDQTNYATGYLPAGPNLSSGRSGTQYFTFKFIRSAVSKFDIKYSGTVRGMWVALPGSVIDSSSGLNGWMNMTQAYAGSGYPGSLTGGNGSDGCSLGGVVQPNVAVTNASRTCTFGTVSSSSTATNEIYIRIALDSGQSVTALSIVAATN